MMESVLKSEFVWKEVETGGESVFVTDVYSVDKFKIVSCMEHDGTITTTIHDDTFNIRYTYVYHVDDIYLGCDAITYYSTIDLNEYTAPSRVDSDIEDSLYYHECESGDFSPYTIRENEEAWWSMGTYFNTSSAKKDRYWRMFNPRNSTDHIYFFAYLDSPEHQYATEYMDFIGQMSALEQTVETYYGASLPITLLSFATPGLTLGAIVDALSLAQLSSDQAQNILDIYGLRDKADTRYSFVLDIHENT